MKNSLCTLFALGFLASGLQGSPRPEAFTFEPADLGELNGPACRIGPKARGTQAKGVPMQVYRDPATGRFGMPPPTVHLDLPQALDIRRRALVETRVMVPGGGVRVDLSGRFASALVARRGAAGEIQITCGHGPSPRRTNDGPTTEEDR